MNILEMMDRPIAFNRAFIALGLGVKASLMLSQAVYWSRRTTKPGGWFYKTQDEWFDEIGLSRKEQETARRELREAGYFEEEKRGVPCKVFYRVNATKLHEDVVLKSQSSMPESDKLECPEVAYSDARKSQTITESTQETTPETTTKPMSSCDDVSEVFEFWKQTMGKRATAKLTTKRRGKIQARLKDGFTVEQIKNAIIGCSKTPWNIGENPTRTRYDDIELICRDESNVERFEANSKNQLAPKARPVHHGLGNATGEDLNADVSGGFTL